jgi:hypothetical protein
LDDLTKPVKIQRFVDLCDFDRSLI